MAPPGSQKRTSILFVLRGRPGLGHVMPGLALARAVQALGVDVHVMTYGAGSALLGAAGILAWSKASVRDSYLEWPGLDVYENGVRDIAECAERVRAGLVVFGGEYLSAPIAKALSLPSAMIFNPEIFEDNARNRIPGALLAEFFRDVDLLVPIAEPDQHLMMPCSRNLLAKMTPAGPFHYRVDEVRSKSSDPLQGPLALVANGGGAHFPKSGASYSSTLADPQRWRDQTIAMTDRAIAELGRALPDHAQIRVYSGLADCDNEALRGKYATDARVSIAGVSIDYYRDLRTASIIVSRAGRGFLADLQRVSCPAVVWPLEQHDEQSQNALAVSEHRPQTFSARTVEGLAGAIERAVAAIAPNSVLGVDALDNSTSVAKLLVERRS